MKMSGVTARNATRRFSSKLTEISADDERRGGLAEDHRDEVERAEAGAAEVGGDGVGEPGAQTGDGHRHDEQAEQLQATAARRWTRSTRVLRSVRNR